MANSKVIAPATWAYYYPYSMEPSNEWTDYGTDTYFSGQWQFAIAYKFTVPKYSAVESEYLKITVPVTAVDSMDADNYYSMNYAVCTSDARRYDYGGNYSAESVEDPSRLYVGKTRNINETETPCAIEITIDTKLMHPGETFYFFFTQAEMGTFRSDLAATTFEIGYTAGLARIGDLTCMCFIGDGTNWIPHTPYVGNGGTSGTDADWDPCS